MHWLLYRNLKDGGRGLLAVFWAFLLQHLILNYWAFRLTHLFAPVQLYFLSLVFSSKFILPFLNFSLIFLIRWLSKHLPSGLPSGRCYAFSCPHTVDQDSPLAFRGSKLYIYIGFHFVSILSLFSLSCLFGCLHLFYSCWRPSSNTRDLPQTMPFILRADSETLTGKRWASLQMKVWPPETSVKDYTHLYVSFCGIFASSKQESFSD